MCCLDCRGVDGTVSILFTVTGTNLERVLDSVGSHEKQFHRPRRAA